MVDAQQRNTYSSINWESLLLSNNKWNSSTPPKMPNPVPLIILGRRADVCILRSLHSHRNTQKSSEAMHEIGICTSRALYLIISEKGGDTSNHPLYPNCNIRGPLPTLDDPRMASYSLAQQKQIIS
eukprot:15366958-Ditylum_brightwellii.AAC.1